MVAKIIIYESIIIITRGHFELYYSILLGPYSLVINASLILRRNTLIQYLGYLWYTFAILCTSTAKNVAIRGGENSLHLKNNDKEEEAIYMHRFTLL